MREHIAAHVLYRLTIGIISGKNELGNAILRSFHNAFSPVESLITRRTGNQRDARVLLPVARVHKVDENLRAQIIVRKVNNGNHSSRARGTSMVLEMLHPAGNRHRVDRGQNCARCRLAQAETCCFHNGVGSGNIFVIKVAFHGQTDAGQKLALMQDGKFFVALVFRNCHEIGGILNVCRRIRSENLGRP